MSNPHEPESLPPSIAEMLRREGQRVEGPNAEAAARIVARVSASIAALPPSGGPPPGGTGGGGAAGAASGFAKAAPYLATLIAGAGVGAGVHALIAQPDPRIVYVDRIVAAPRAPTTSPATPPTPATPSSAAVSVDDLPSAAVSGSARRAAAPRPVPDAGDDAFVLERRLLDVARANLASGDHERTLKSLDEHARAYSAGSFVEEREALRVRALADAGRIDEARAAAARFESRWPKSVLLPTVRNAPRSP